METSRTVMGDSRWNVALVVGKTYPILDETWLLCLACFCRSLASDSSCFALHQHSRRESLTKDILTKNNPSTNLSRT